jgi:two-component system clock-associated histidine kinase SasA
VPHSHDLSAISKLDKDFPVSLQLLLFVDDRRSSKDIIQKIERHLCSLPSSYCYQLQVIDIYEQPHLVEHFRLVATPALVKIFPDPKHTLAGSNIVDQLNKWWGRWQSSLQELQERPSSEDMPINGKSSLDSVGYSSEVIKLSDDVFRLQKEKEELLGQIKFKDQVLAMLAHDLRSPLTAASLALETLELADTQPDTERTVQLREQLYQQARKQFSIMKRLISDILQASKNMSAQLEVHHSELFLQFLCAEILQIMNGQFQEKSLNIKQDLPQDLPAVYADEELIRQVIVNLLENAIKYTPKGGTISISILHRTTQKIQVSISDTGPGIPGEKQERIFEGHFRLKRDEAQEGFGLGLALCRKIIGAHYGQIWVDSTAGEGSCFQFTLPVYRR